MAPILIKNGTVVNADHSFKACVTNWTNLCPGPLNSGPNPAQSFRISSIYLNISVGWIPGLFNVTQNKSDVLIRNGKIHKVGENLEAPEGCEVYDATDRLGRVNSYRSEI